MTVATTNELTCITVDTPERRLDIAVPAHVPLAELVAVLIRAGGERLADRGAASGWVVRDPDGTVLSGAKTLDDQGVRDGSVLHLVPASQTWPEPEFDDIADAIASTRRDADAWSAAATRRLSAGAGVTAMLIALVSIVRNSPHSTASAIAGGMALVLLGAGSLWSRTSHRHRTGAVLAGLALPYAFVAGILARGGQIHGTDLFAAGIVTVAVGLIAMVGVGHVNEVFIGGILAAVIGAAGAVGVQFMPSVDAAAILLGATALGAGLIPAASVRIGGLGGWPVGAADPTADIGDPPAADAASWAAAIERSKIVVTGLNAGVALAATACAAILAAGGSPWSRLLVLASASALAFRALAYGTISQRIAALAAGAGTLVPLLVWVLWSGTESGAAAAGLIAAGLFALVLGAGKRRFPVLVRAASLLEIVSILAVVPLLCGAVGLYAKARGLG
jgi:type VII secretion integral membrane protein EccD